MQTDDNTVEVVIHKELRAEIPSQSSSSAGDGENQKWCNSKYNFENIFEQIVIVVELEAAV